MKSFIYSTLVMLLLASCGSDPETPSMNSDNNTQISSEDYNNLTTPCADESNTIALPNPMTIMSNYIQYEATTEIYSAQQLSISLLSTLSSVILPSPNALYAEADGITVYNDETAYEWKVGADTYIYKLRNEGYDIYFYKDSDIFSSGYQLVRMEQREDCTYFGYTQFAIEDDGDTKIGDKVFRLEYRKEGNTSIRFGVDIDSEDGEEYYIRTFADLSGEMDITQKDQITRSYLWQSDGSGSYDIFENGTVVNSGLWSF